MARYFLQDTSLATFERMMQQTPKSYKNYEEKENSKGEKGVNKRDENKNQTGIRK